MGKSKAAAPEIVKRFSTKKPSQKRTPKKSLQKIRPIEIKTDIPVNGEENKYYESPVMHKFMQGRQWNFPITYGDNKIVIMIRDPYWIHSYFELSNSKINEIKSEIGSDLFSKSKKIIRVYDVTDIIFAGLNANKTFDIDIFEDSKNWYINVGESNRSWCVDIGYLTPEGRFYVAARSNVITTPRDGMSDVIDEEWMTIDWEKIFALSGGFGIGKSSAEIKEIFKKRFQEEMASGFVSSWGGRAETAQSENDFWLIANAELIVYGATEPTAKLSVQGIPVKLRPDGTFSMRFALPDGRQEIPITAQDSLGRHKKSIIPIVEKRTV